MASLINGPPLLPLISLPSVKHPTPKRKDHKMLKLSCTYSKKLGLPGYSSHQFSVSLESELADVSQVQQESSRLYALLQQSVDSNIREVGFLPGSNGNGHGNGNGQHRQVQPTEERWNCSDKQRELILKIIAENHLEKNHVENLAQDRFGKGVKSLNKLEASGLIDELLEQTGQKKPGRRFQRAGGR
jgi:hypothetical protein